jgi:murein DD-endopeptidase MepM/ murein hydrolase activator NlpD
MNLIPNARLAVVLVAVTLVVAAGGATGASPAAPCWAPPVVGEVVDPFREPACRWCPGNRGVEYRTVPGSPIRAVGSGTVTFSGVVAGERYVVVRLANGWLVTYGNVQHTPVVRGDVIVARSVVGTAGASFHLGLRVDGRYRDPAEHIGAAVGRARLIPTDGSRPRAVQPAATRLVCGRSGDSVGGRSAPG